MGRMTLAEQAAELLKKSRSEALAKRREAVDELEQLLLRNEKPRPGDDVRLAQLLDDLRIDAEEVPPILELVQNREELRALQERSDDINSEYYEACRAYNAVGVWRDSEVARINAEAVQRTRELEARRNMLGAPVSRLKALKAQADRMNSRWNSFRDNVVDENDGTRSWL